MDNKQSIGQNSWCPKKYRNLEKMGQIIWYSKKNIENWKLETQQLFCLPSANQLVRWVLWVGAMICLATEAPEQHKEAPPKFCHWTPSFLCCVFPSRSVLYIYIYTIYIHLECFHPYFVPVNLRRLIFHYHYAKSDSRSESACICFW